MRPRTWETNWRERHSRELWTAPDPDVVDLVRTLRSEGARRVLDLGFGLGRHLILFAREGFETHGIEPTTSGYAHCRDWLNAEGLHADIRMGEMSWLPYPDGFFDFVLSWNVIYHGALAQVRRAIGEIGRITRPGGLVYLTLNSTRNRDFGHGTEVETNTFMNPSKSDGDLPHHYSDEEEVRGLLEGWDTARVEEREESFAGTLFPGTYHWMVLARKP